MHEHISQLLLFLRFSFALFLKLCVSERPRLLVRIAGAQSDRRSHRSISSPDVQGVSQLLQSNARGVSARLESRGCGKAPGSIIHAKGRSEVNPPVTDGWAAVVGRSFGNCATRFLRADRGLIVRLQTAKGCHEVFNLAGRRGFAGRLSAIASRGQSLARAPFRCQGTGSTDMQCPPARRQRRGPAWRWD
jgi:hypothetical protein